MGKKLSRHKRNRNTLLVVAWVLVFYGVYSGGTTIFWGGLALINAYACYLMAHDKHAAREHAFRIPENSLLVTAGLGGSLGAAVGMVCFHHKTKHPRFVVLIPLFLAVHLFLLWFFKWS
ncbi:DUF1294 domain-containing protein [Brevibacillus ginsengisoli]|uniref:DUF1294 domain-containing protein n=1 Tax=Brevibacillus ginsengisoli TaxID=363854 RepID=UPI003CF7799E